MQTKYRLRIAHFDLEGFAEDENLPDRLAEEWATMGTPSGVWRLQLAPASRGRGGSRRRYSGAASEACSSPEYWARRICPWVESDQINDVIEALPEVLSAVEQIKQALGNEEVLQGLLKALSSKPNGFSGLAR